MKIIRNILVLLTLTYTSVIANNSTINKVKRINIPFYETKTLKDLASNLEQSRWKSLGSNSVRLGGVFFANKRRNKLSLEYTITINQDSTLKTMEILGKLEEKGNIIEVHKVEYQGGKWVYREWNSYSAYQNNPNMNHYENPEPSLKGLYKAIFKERR